VSTILFDLDRTLVDVQSFTDYSVALADVEALIGAWDDPPTPPTGWDGPTRRAMGILVALGGDPRWTSVSEVIERHELSAVPRSTAMPGLADALALVEEVSKGVVTLLPDRAAHAALDRHGVEIPVVVGRRSDLAVKPAPDQLFAACHLLDADPGATTMIGDSTWDFEAARAAGCHFVGVTNGGPNEFPSEVAVANTPRPGRADLVD
jgi:phosphoglycolate phosphatase